MTLTLPTLCYAEAARLLNLPATEDHREQAALLRARRAFHLEVLAAPDPPAWPTASLLRLKTSRREEIALCEQLLDVLGEPYEIPREDEDD